MNVQEIREKFSEFFQKNGHEKVSSSSLIPHNDDTLLFANAGMNQFKDYFTGKTTPPYKRAYSIQKCVRAGGKHNDLNNVGFTARHHTFFEMLGNFSFGDYFKKEAIQLAWAFLTQELKIPQNKLYITVHHTDDEAFKIWHQDIEIPIDRIFKKDDKDNFWEMGEFGPCGPCSEIFFDHGQDFATPGFQPKKNQDILDDELRYVEIWNLVFMQFEKTPQGRHPLPNPCIDTGMGLERIAACLQNVYWNYDTDGFQEIRKAIENLTNTSYQNPKYTGSIRVIADHIRSSTMLITDGVIPSNEGRGYVLRRIIRRAIRHLKELGAKDISFYKLVPIVLKQLGKEYPQNLANQEMAEKFLHLEEKKFLETLDQGLKFLKNAIEKDVIKGTLRGDSAFKLYDTYGFPLDLTETILAEKKLNVDISGFNKAMQNRKEESRKSWKGGQLIDNKIFHQIREKRGATQFVGYDSLITKGKLLEIVESSEQKALIFDTTAFYGESGGQVGDIGEIREDGIKIADISDTQKLIDDLYIHYSKNADALEVGKKYELVVDKKNRLLTMRNHSATHLLQTALIKVLGNHVKQAGSHVGPMRLRFDFTHMQAISDEEINNIEKIVNEQIQTSLPIQASVMSMNEAMEKGAMALFGEKYGNQVRVLEMGKFSTELCGGTHISNTNEIGLFSIISESSLSSGVRRIEATTSETAINRLVQRSKYLKEIELITSTKGNHIVEKIQNLFNEIKNKQKQIQELKDKISSVKSDDLFSKPLTLKENIHFIATEAPIGSDLRKLSDLFVGKFEKGILLLHTKNKGKLSILLRATKNMKSIKCNEILKETLPLLNGRGGGRPDMAQGSGDLGDVESFTKKVQSLIELSF